MQKTLSFLLLTVLGGGKEQGWQAKGARGIKKASRLCRAKACGAGGFLPGYCCRSPYGAKRGNNQPTASCLPVVGLLT